MLIRKLVMVPGLEHINISFTFLSIGGTINLKIFLVIGSSHEIVQEAEKSFEIKNFTNRS